MIIEKKRRGDGDFIGHSLDLFIDFMQVFRKILILLMQKVNINYGKFSGHAIVCKIEYLYISIFILSCIAYHRKREIR